MSDQQLPEAEGKKVSRPPARGGFFDDARVGKAVFIALIVSCGLAVLSDFFYHKHGHFEFELWPAFHALFGFAAYLLIVNAAKLLRLLVKRPEGYYGEGEDS